jgi:hypothetical protein
VRSLYFKIFSASFWITFLSPGTVTSINILLLLLLLQTEFVILSKLSLQL